MIIGYIIKRWIGELKYDKYEKIYEQSKKKKIRIIWWIIYL